MRRSTAQTQSGQSAIKDDIIYYYHNDHLGSPCFLSDEVGSIAWRREQTPFGETSFERGTTTENLRFPGQYYDAETGLAQNWHRDYNAGLGRYVEADPVGIMGDYNIYVYVRNNSNRYIDPLGLLAYDDVKSLVAVNNLSGQSNELIICVCWKESGFNPNAQSNSSSARGLMQITRAAAQDVGYSYDKLFDPAYNIAAGSKYLGLRIKWAGGNVASGLDGYGTGPGYSTNILQCEKCLIDTPCEYQKCLNNIHH